MLKVYVERDLSQEAETAAMMAIIELLDEEENCLYLPELGLGAPSRDVHISPDLPPDKRQELKGLICEYKHIFTD